MKEVIIGLAVIASITGLGFYTYSTIIGGEPLLNYAVSLLGTSTVSMLLWQYHLTAKAYEKNQEASSK